MDSGDRMGLRHPRPSPPRSEGRARLSRCGRSTACGELSVPIRNRLEPVLSQREQRFPQRVGLTRDAAPLDSLVGRLRLAHALDGQPAKSAESATAAVAHASLKEDSRVPCPGDSEMGRRFLSGEPGFRSQEVSRRIRLFRRFMPLSPGSGIAAERRLHILHP